MSGSKNSQLKEEALIAFTESEKLPLRIIEDIERSHKALEHLKEKFKNKTFILLIFSLTHEVFSEKLSEEYWHAIVKHHRYLTKLMSRSPGISVAALDYLKNIACCLISPKIISDDKSQLITNAAIKDKLTHLYTRNVFDISLAKQCSQVKKHGIPVSLALLDIDDFKHINDSFGHICGDHVLTEIGDSIIACIRDADIPARYGGEELAIIMPRTNIDDAKVIAERLRAKIASNKIGGVNVTASIGVAATKENQFSAELLLKAADSALYHAKRNGKNAVCVDPAQKA
jgi:diguanylate cyclase (GGDEF)-like protein